MTEMDDKLVEMIKNLIESKTQASWDFCGDQRDWHLPRLNKAVVLAIQLFPLQAAQAMEQARNPYGDKLAEF